MRKASSSVMTILVSLLAKCVTAIRIVKEGLTSISAVSCHWGSEPRVQIEYFFKIL